MFTITFHRSLKVDLIFAGEADFTHITQDQDHDVPHSQRVTMTTADRERGRGGGRQHHLSLMHNNSSINTDSDSPYAHGYSEYIAPDPSATIQDVQWASVWVGESEFL
jgi:hypothetical protein